MPTSLPELHTPKSFAQEWLDSRPPQNRQALLAQLREKISTEEDDNVDKALFAIGLSLFESDRTLRDQDLAWLDPNRRALVRQYHQVMVALAEQLTAGASPIDVDAVMEQLDKTLRDHPIRIKKIDLCQRVRGYGVYEPFESHVFLAGRVQPMIIYAELKHFHCQKTDEERYQVKLTQEVVLYNESDGLAVWRQPTVDIVDESRNRRHDFFVVQMVRLPARLTVGKYRLKVRMTDRYNGSLDESTIPIQIVADQSLVSGHQP